MGFGRTASKAELEKGVAQVYLVLVAVLLLSVFGILSWFCWIADSEIWATTLATHLSEDWSKHWVFFRLFFYAPLALAMSPFQSSDDAVMAARMFCMLNGVAIAGLIFQISKRLYRSSLTPLFAVILLVGNTGFINQGFRIRSDLFTTTLALIVFLGLLEPASSNRRKVLRRTLPWVALLATTPKAIVQFLALGISYRTDLLPRAAFQKKKSSALILSVVGLAVLIFGVTFRKTLYEGLFSDIQYTYRAISGLYGNSEYFSLLSFRYLGKLIWKNPIFTVIFLASFWREGLKLLGRDASSAPQDRFRQNLLIYISLLSLWALFSPEKLPFLLASLLPFFCIFAASSVDAIAAAGKQWSVRGLMVIVTFTMASGLVSAWDNYINNSNFEQRQAIRSLDEMLNRYPKATYYDPIGIVPRRATLRHFAGPNESNTESTVEILRDRLPDFIFTPLKANYLQPQLGELLKKYYIDFDIGLYARAYPIEVPHGNLPFEIRVRQAFETLKKIQPLAMEQEATFRFSSPQGKRRLVIASPSKIAQVVDFKLAENIWVSPYLAPKIPLRDSLLMLFRFDTEF